MLFRSPRKGAVAPADFLAVAETTGMIVPIGAWVLRQACLQASVWPQSIAIAVNLSPSQFGSGNIAESVAAALRASGLAPRRLELEITESSLLEMSLATRETLKSLTDMGASIVLDDFGTGYSGLGYLNAFPISKIKIDRTFVENIGSERKSLELVRAAVNLGHNLGLAPLAEGIETTEQLGILRQLGCQFGQGYLFGEASPASKVTFPQGQRRLIG